MRVRVQYFARAREGAGTEGEELELAAGATLGSLWQKLLSAHPALKPLDGAVSFLIDTRYVREPDPLREGDTVFVLPPVSGG